MDIAKLRNITNNYQDVRLISLRKWKGAADVVPRDAGGPYVIYQIGFDPEDLKMIPTDFVLSRSGQWTRLAIFLGLSREIRRQEFIFGTASEVMTLMHELGNGVQIIRTGKDFVSREDAEEGRDDLTAELLRARQDAAPLPRIG